MKEFDFEELDRAVNSLMSDVKKPDATQPAENTVSLTTQPATSPSPEPVVTLPETPAEPVVAAPTPVTAPTNDTTPTPPSLPPPDLPTRPSTPILPPRRGGGRFMDVVHPSSDMSSPASPTPLSTRQGKPLEPLTMTEAPKPAGPVIDVMAPVALPSNPEVEAPTTNDTPEPTNVTPEEMPSGPSTPSEPWTSPFLPDAQVEKRPLGASLPESSGTGLSEAIAAELSKEHPSEETPATPPAEPIEAAKEQEPASMSEPSLDVTPAEPEDTKDNDAPAPSNNPELNLNAEPVAMPAELNNDLVAIESGQKDTPLVEDASMTGSFESASNTSNTSSPAIISTGSIPPQYNEQPSSGDASHTPIYDNEAAHQPLAHPAKKKKSWVLVVFILAILVVGGGLGAAAYFLGLV